LARLANLYTANPRLVNPDLAPSDQGLYFQVVHDFLSVFGLGMQDLTTPANTPPF
jgi:hypothetical protein